MKRYIFTVRHLNKRGDMSGNIFRVRNNNIEWVTDFEYRLGCCRGSVSEAFQALMRCGEIPKKYETSSVTEWSGAGYFMGEVTKHYDIVEVF